MVYFLVERTVLIVDNLLGFLVEEFHLVLYPIVHTLIEDSEDIVLLPDIDVNVLEILFSLKQFPIVELLELFFLHDFFKLRKEIEKLPDEEVADNV